MPRCALPPFPLVHAAGITVPGWPLLILIVHPPLTGFSPCTGLPSWCLVLYLGVESHASAAVLASRLFIAGACNTTHGALLLHDCGLCISTAWLVTIADLLGVICPALLICLLAKRCHAPGCYCCLPACKACLRYGALHACHAALYGNSCVSKAAAAALLLLVKPYP